MSENIRAHFEPFSVWRRHRCDCTSQIFAEADFKGGG